MSSQDMAEFTIRDARPGDRDEVLALTAYTWEGGDYIHWVFDEWVDDETGRFLVAEERSTGRIAGIDKMSFLSPTEAWFEGLRVHPDFRGRGLATRFEGYMVNEAGKRGARTIRLLTNVGNLPVHRNAYRHAFSQRFIVRHWKWPVAEQTGSPLVPTEPGLDLRRATPEESPLLYDWWLRSPSWQATGGLLNRNWSYSATSPKEWEARAANGDILIPGGIVISKAILPPPFAIVSLDTSGDKPRWIMSTLSATAEEWVSLAVGLVASAGQRGVEAISGLLPDAAYIYSALTEAGFTSGPDSDSFSLFELHLT
jgi:N-acetylglutamate synthase-like GNAT family acetyltransferase